ncbi:MAG: 2Fe-2S iron-sulfur cluster-binding protein [Spirochaetia bacterium]|jgi:carbon-monoxide dehydrogenase small subunit|nr:2Fe-2S iron-sulfur cluster-binding protein [Spirochaetia bacterium]
MRIEFILNGKKVGFDTHAETRLVDLLKNSAKVQSLRTSCYKGICRGCSVLFNGDLVSSCLIPVFQARDSEIVSYEGLSKSYEIKDILSGFEDEEYFPCDYCRPGKIMTIHSILESYSDPDDNQILEAFEGINCSCTDKSTLLKAVKTGAFYRRRRRRARNI